MAIRPPPNVVATKRNNDIVRLELVKKRKKEQVHQGEKMKKAYADSLQQSAKNVTQALVVTVFVDRRVASHARGVLLWRGIVQAQSLPALKLESSQTDKERRYGGFLLMSTS